MTNLYTYMFERCSQGQWRTIRRVEKRSARDPESFARGLLELWLIRQRRPPSGRIVVVGRRGEIGRRERSGDDAVVRIRVYPGRVDGEVAALQPSLATAFLMPWEGEGFGAAA